MCSSRFAFAVLLAAIAAPAAATATTVLSFNGDIGRGNRAFGFIVPYYGGTFSGGLTFNETLQPERGVNYTAPIDDFAVTFTSPDGSRELTLTEPSSFAPSEVNYNFSLGDGRVGLAANIIAAIDDPSVFSGPEFLRFALQVGRDCGEDTRVRTGLIGVRPSYDSVGLQGPRGSTSQLPTLCGGDTDPGDGGIANPGDGGQIPAPVPLPAGLPLLIAALVAMRTLNLRRS